MEDNDKIANELKAGMEELLTKEDFPLDVFPEDVKEIIQATNECLLFPIEFTAGSMLFASAVAIGNSYQVQVKNEWLEGVRLFIVLAGRAGSNKSHPLAFAIKPIQEHDNRSFKEYKMKKREYDEAQQLSKKERRKEELDSIQKPYWKKFLLQDYTQEALVDVHNSNPKGVAVYADEFLGWINNFTRYNKGSETEFWLSIWSGKSITIDRKSKDPISIPCPSISVCGTIQTYLLNNLTRDNNSHNGFIDRVLFIVREDPEKLPWNEREIDPSITAKWKGILTKLMNLPLNYDSEGLISPQVIQISDEAKKLSIDWFNSNAEEVNKCDNEIVASIYAKFDNYLHRFALILQLLYYASDESDLSSVSARAYEGAIKLVDYFKNSALRVSSLIKRLGPLDELTEMKKLVYSNLPEVFETREGIAIAKELGMPQRTFQTFLTNSTFFKRLEQGKLKKII